MKLMSGTDGSIEIVPATTTYGLKVDIGRMSHCLSSDLISSSWIITNSGSNVAWLADSGNYRYITHISVMNSDPNNGSIVRFCNGADGTGIKYQGYAAPGGGGFSNDFEVPIRFDNSTQITFRALTSGCNLCVNIIGFNSSQ
jgi:hypothetical protein